MEIGEDPEDKHGGDGDGVPTLLIPVNNLTKGRHDALVYMYIHTHTHAHTRACESFHSPQTQGMCKHAKHYTVDYA